MFSKPDPIGEVAVPLGGSLGLLTLPLTHEVPRDGPALDAYHLLRSTARWSKEARSTFAYLEWFYKGGLTVYPRRKAKIASHSFI